MSEQDELRKLVRAVSRLTLGVAFGASLVIAMLIYYIVDPSVSAVTQLIQEKETVVTENPDLIENGVHVRTGLIEAEGLMSVVNNCTNCHSAKLVIQNRMNTERWKSTIQWMQRTQNLWDLGDQEEVIINYLVKNYPPPKKGRRQALSDIQWYKLED